MMIYVKTSHEEGQGSKEQNGDVVVVTINKGMTIKDAKILVDEALDENEGPVDAGGCIPPAMALVMKCLRERGREDEWITRIH